jgi:hypothetical protein
LAVLSNLLPGIRELRAPLAAGYLWLLAAWLFLADVLPSRTEVDSDGVERIYRLQPLVSDIGVAIVASVAAYVLGSIVIDLQTGIGRALTNRVPLRDRRNTVSAALDTSTAGREVLEAVLEASQRAREWARRAEESSEDAALIREARWIKAAGWIAESHAVLKTRLLDISSALHSEVDRPDAEATFRMALWPPLAVISLYLMSTTSVLWVWALALPLALAAQWKTLRRRSNDALVTAIATREELCEAMLTGAFGARSLIRSAEERSSSPASLGD